MIIICGIVFVVFIGTIIYYISDDFKEYSYLKPDFLNYYCLIFREIIIDIEAIVCEKVSFKVSDKKLYHPCNRPVVFFQKGEKVYFFNIQKTWPHYGGDMGLVLENMPEGLLRGTVVRNDDETTTVIIGEKELQIYRDSELLMHDWELTTLTKNPLARRFYCLGLNETDQNLKKALKATPLY